MARPIDPEKGERILQTAIGLFTECGYNNTTTALIAQRAGMSSAHMYIYYKDKRALLKSAIVTMMAEHTAEVTEVAKLSSKLSPERFVDACFDVLARIRPRALFIISAYITPGFEDVFEGIDLDYSGVFRGYMADLPEEVAVSASRMLMSLSDSYFLIGDEDRVKTAAVQLLKAIKE